MAINVRKKSEPLFQIPPDIDLLNPAIDVTFKSMFTKDSEDSRIALRGLVSALIEKDVIDVTILKNEIPVDDMKEKFIRLDLNCVLWNKEKVNIEMQMSMDKDDQIKRSIYYLSKLIVSQELKGDLYKSINNVYQIMITNFSILKDSKKSLSRFEFVRRCDNYYLECPLKLIFLELPKIKYNNDTKAENLSEAEKWGIFIRDVQDLKKREKINKLFYDNQSLQKAGRILMRLSLLEIEKTQQMSREKYMRDYASFMSQMEHAEEFGLERGIQQGFEKGIQQGIEQGLEKGIQQGLEKGIQQGIEKGIQQGIEQGSKQKLLETALNFKKMGLSNAQIAQGTGLSIEEIEAL